MISDETNEKPLPQVRAFDGLDWFSTKIHRRNLPHWELPGSSYFITTRVDATLNKPFQDSALAKYMVSSLHRYDNEKYLLQAYVVMPDHFHLIIKPMEGNKLSQILQKLKGSTAYNINKMLNRHGNFWQTENFDHLIRDAAGMRKFWEYIRDNPVTAKLVEKAEDYPFSSFYVPKMISG